MTDPSPLPTQRNLAEDVKVLVSFLKSPPFSRTFTLVTFSQLSPLDLLQLTNDVFASLDPAQARDLRDEPSDLTTHRMIDFLITTLFYQPPSLPPSPSPEALASFGSSFISAAPATLYPVLLYLLTHYESLKKRVYLSAFLSTPPVPLDMQSDPTIAALLSAYQQRQAEFTDLHRQTEAVRGGALHATHLRKEVDQLESEREQLKTKMKRLTQKVDMEGDDPSSTSTPSTFNSMLRLTHLLRLEQEEEAKLLQQREEQKTRLDDLRGDVAHLSTQYEELCKYHGVGKEGGPILVNPLQLIARMKAEVKEEADEVERRLQVELMDVQKQLKGALKANEALGGDVWTEDDIDDMKVRVVGLERQVKQLEAEKVKMIGGEDSQLAFLYDRLTAVQKKRAKMELKVKGIEGECEEVRLEQRKLDVELDLLARQRANEERDGVPRGGKELKRYMEELTVKTAKYKEVKATLDVGYAENAVLSSTLNTLKSRVNNQVELNQQLERLQGVEGWSEAEGRLMDFAVKSRAVDDQKAETLEDISALVDSIEQQIKAKKNVLAPSIKELRLVRGQFEGVEGEWKAGKDSHEKVGLRYESERLKLEGEVKEKEEEKETAERAIWRARLQAQALKVREEGLNDKGKVKAYEEEVDRCVKALEKREKALQKEKKAMNDNGNAHVNQRQMFKNLELLLNTKQKGMHGGEGRKGDTGGRENDRLVL